MYLVNLLIQQILKDMVILILDCLIRNHLFYVHDYQYYIAKELLLMI